MAHLLVTHDDAGTIQWAGVHEILNAETYAADGYLVYGDGRARPLVPGTVLYPVTHPLAADVLAWGREGKYYVSGGALYEVDGWQEPVAPEPEEVLL